MDATCVQFGSRGKEFHPQGGEGEECPQIYKQLSHPWEKFHFDVNVLYDVGILRLFSSDAQRNKFRQGTLRTFSRTATFRKSALADFRNAPQRSANHHMRVVCPRIFSSVSNHARSTQRKRNVPQRTAKHRNVTRRNTLRAAGK